MTVFSTPTASLKKTGLDNIVSSPPSETKLTNVSANNVRNEESISSILSPSAESQISQEENVVEGDDDSENDNIAWKGDAWSQEDVR